MTTWARTSDGHLMEVVGPFSEEFVADALQKDITPPQSVAWNLPMLMKLQDFGRQNPWAPRDNVQRRHRAQYRAHLERLRAAT